MKAKLPMNWIAIVSVLGAGGLKSAAQDSELGEVYKSSDPHAASLLDKLPAKFYLQTLMIAGMKREYVIYVPTSENELPKPRPLLVFLHGAKGVARERLIRVSLVFAKMAEERKIVTVFPTAAAFGKTRHWRCIGFTTKQRRDGVDDVMFLKTLVEAVSEQTPIDKSRVYACGHSSGAAMCHRLAAEASETFAAVVPLNHNMWGPVGSRFSPRYPVSLLTIVGDNDPLVPFVGQKADRDAEDVGRRFDLSSFHDTVAKYRKLNGVTGEPSVSQLPDKDPADGTTVHVTQYPPGKDGFLVGAWVVVGGGHIPPGISKTLTTELSNQDLVLKERVWEFLQKCPPRTVATQ